MLAVRLIRADLDTTVFTVLSYVWGDQSVRIAIKINGQQFLVGQNLHTVLCELRSWRSRQYIWADVVCVSQKDDQEKTQQVHDT